MSALGPRQTEPDAWIRWIREAVALLLRRPAAVAGYLATVIGVYWVAHLTVWGPMRTLLMLVVATLALVLFIRLALAVDYNRPLHPGFVLPANLDAAVAVTLAAALFAAHGVVAPALFDPLHLSFNEAVEVLGLYEPRLETGAPAPDPLTYGLLGPLWVTGGLFGAALLGTGLGMLAFGQWFLLPMVVLHGAPPIHSAAVSARAYRSNPVAMTGLLGVFMAAVVVLVVSLGWAGPLLAPLLGAVLYTSYRDVFLGRDANHPVGLPIPTELELALEPEPADLDDAGVRGGTRFTPRWRTPLGVRLRGGSDRSGAGSGACRPPPTRHPARPDRCGAEPSPGNDSALR